MSFPDTYFGLQNDMWFEASIESRKYWKEQNKKEKTNDEEETEDE